MEKRQKRHREVWRNQNCQRESTSTETKHLSRRTSLPPSPPLTCACALDDAGGRRWMTGTVGLVVLLSVYQPYHRDGTTGMAFIRNSVV